MDSVDDRHTDSRANSVVGHVVAPHARQHPGGQSLYFDGPEEAGRQILDACAGVEVDWFHAAREFRRFEEYGYRMDFEGEVPVEALDVLRSLEGHLIVRTPEGGALTHAVALDWYKVPDPDVDPKDWKNTTTGELIYRGKYYKDVNANTRYRTMLAQIMSEVAKSHPLMGGAAFVAAVPGNSENSTHFGELLAQQVAFSLGKPLVQLEAPKGHYAPAKARETGEIRLVNFQYRCVENCHGTVLVVDDVYRSGATLRRAAEALKNAGAADVFGLVGARTLRH